MNATAKFTLFLFVAAIQLLVPASMIRGYEKTLNDGLLVKFRCEPIDPYDPFRGRYVALQFERDPIPHPRNRQLPPRYMPACVEVAVGDGGFADIRDVTMDAPRSKDYFRARVMGTRGGEVYLDYPFDQFFMDEFSAPAAERAYRESMVESDHDTYVTVRVRKGYAIIENLFIGGIPVRDYLAGQNPTSTSEVQSN